MVFGHYIYVASPRKKSGSESEGKGYRDLLAVVESFLRDGKQPAVVEPGEPITELRSGEYALTLDAEGVLLEVWSGERLLRRRLKAVRKAGRGRLDLVAERFPRRRGTISLLDAASATAGNQVRESMRGVAREQLRRWCERLRPSWHIDQLSAGTDLENSLSPRFPRALLRLGTQGACAIAAPEEHDAADCFSFGLIWLEHARQRWPQLQIRNLLFLVPEGTARAFGFRLMACNHARVCFELYAWSADGRLEEVAAREWGNAESAFLVARAAAPPHEQARVLFEEVATRTAAECVTDMAGGLSLEIFGLPFAQARNGELRAGLKLRLVEKLPSHDALVRTANRIARHRCAEAADRAHPLYRAYPERWLESVVRTHIREIDPLLDPARMRRQVSGSLGLHHTRTDLLAVDANGRLVVVELKAAEDIHLVGQAIDYYSRLRVQLARGELDASALFPGFPVRRDAPRVLLVAPALCFHPANETVLRFVESSIQVRQIGLALEWRKKPRVVFEHSHTQWQRGGNREWLAISSIKSGRPSPR